MLGLWKNPVFYYFRFLGGYGTRTQFILFPCIQGLMVTGNFNGVGMSTEACDSGMCSGISVLVSAFIWKNADVGNSTSV